MLDLSQSTGFNCLSTGSPAHPPCTAGRLKQRQRKAASAVHIAHLLGPVHSSTGRPGRSPVQSPPPRPRDRASLCTAHFLPVLVNSREDFTGGFSPCSCTVLCSDIFPTLHPETKRSDKEHRQDTLHYMVITVYLFLTTSPRAASAHLDLGPAQGLNHHLHRRRLSCSAAPLHPKTTSPPPCPRSARVFPLVHSVGLFSAPCLLAAPPHGLLGFLEQSVVSWQTGSLSHTPPPPSPSQTESTSF